MDPLHPTVSQLGRILLNDRNFTIGAKYLLPFVSYTKVSTDGKIMDIDGFVYQIILYLVAKYQFNFEYVKSVDGALGALENGSWNGLVGMMHRREIDIVAASLTVTYPRSQVVEFTVPFNDDTTSILIPYPELDSNINGVTRPFQFEVWIGMGISVLLITFILRKILSIESVIYDRNSSIISLSESFWSLIEFQNAVRHNHATGNSRTAVRLMMAACCLITTVFVNAYSSCITSYLLTPRYTPMINSIEDIFTIPRPVFMVPKYSATEAPILNAKSGLLLKVKDYLNKYPELRLPSHDTAVELVSKYHRTYTLQNSALLCMIEKDMKETGECRVYLAKESWYTSQQALALPKSSPLIHIFNREINWARQVGLLDYWKRSYWPRKNRCTEPLTNKKPGNHDRLSLFHVSSAFLLLGCSIGISLVVFLIELCCYRLKC